MSTGKRIKKCLVVIEDNLILPVIDELSDIKIDLEKKMAEIISLEEGSCTAHDEYQQLYKLCSTC